MSSKQEFPTHALSHAASEFPQKARLYKLNNRSGSTLSEQGDKFPVRWKGYSWNVNFKEVRRKG